VATTYAIIARIEELEAELRNNNLWQKDIPSWVDEYDNTFAYMNNDFAQWLQFVFIPNHLYYIKSGNSTNRISLVPQAMKHFDNDIKKGKLLQVLIEIDAML
jgi:uncharacterized protein YqcC (DUF446 family)